jgi:hypothetical protein
MPVLFVMAADKETRSRPPFWKGAILWAGPCRVTASTVARVQTLDADPALAGPHGIGLG